MEQKVTIYTLAEKLNMSVSAVSRAFNPNSKLSADHSGGCGAVWLCAE